MTAELLHPQVIAVSYKELRAVVMDKAAANLKALLSLKSHNSKAFTFTLALMFRH